MPTESKKTGILSNNALKILASLFMISDHVGVILFPNIIWLRIVGRLAFPIFAYLIAEGAKYTRSKVRHFLTMLAFALVIQVVYFIYEPSNEMSVLVTFTLSLAVIYALEFFKSALFSASAKTSKKLLGALLFFGSIAAVCALSLVLDLDYGAEGALLPVFPALFTTPKTDGEPPAIFNQLDTKCFRILATALGTLALAIADGGIQYLGLCAIPLLFLYSEQRGRLKMKYFFYIFYPAHLLLIYAISMMIN
ncbi:MAG: hypothetical protein IJD74_00065 [Clostridia bacterium]|nr:hypothetical protein [Clostridia bacterium]